MIPVVLLLGLVALLIFTAACSATAWRWGHAAGRADALYDEALDHADYYRRRAKAAEQPQPETVAPLVAESLRRPSVATKIVPAVGDTRPSVLRHVEFDDTQGDAT
jgi:hypothetical protein